MLKAMHHDSAAGRAKGSFFPLKPHHLTDTHPTRLVHSLQQREQRPVRTKGREIKTFLMPHSSWVAWEVTHSCSHNLYNSHKQSLILLMFSKKTWAIWQNNLDRLIWTLCYLVKIPSSQCESSWLRQELKFCEAFCPDHINNRSNIQNGYFRNSLLCSSVKCMFNLPVPNTHPVPLTLLGM